MEYFKLTGEILEKAKDYAPLSVKEKIVNDCALLCYNVVNINVSEDNSAEGALPPMYAENSSLKARFLMGAFVKEYLGIDFEPCEGTEYLLAQDEYDRYAGGHIFNQIERLKTAENGKYRDKCFDILQDYKDLEKKFNTEVYNLTKIRNDICARLKMILDASASPERMQDALKELETLKDEIDKRQAEKEAEATPNE